MNAAMPTFCTVIDASHRAAKAESMDRPKRARPTHRDPSIEGNQTIIIFLTLCVRDRRPILANDQVTALMPRWWQRADSWLVGRFVIMPDHIHLFCAPTNSASTLSKWIQFWKNGTTREWPSVDCKPIWQRDFWDRQLRVAERYDEKWEYVRDNPRRHGLVDRSEDWRYQGEVNHLEWHDR